MNGIAKFAGCRPPWHTWSSSDIDVCETSSNVLEYGVWETQMTAYEQELIMKETGCLKPCKYREYLSAGVTSKLENFTQNGKYCVQYYIASTVLDRKKEAYVYPAISYISEIGGSLGLFVGFSCLTIWDCFDSIFDKILSKKEMQIYF